MDALGSTAAPKDGGSSSVPYTHMTDDPLVVPVDMTSQMGLRGLLSLYIVVYHCIHYSTDIELQGSAHMSFFFLLSGFALAVGYGAKRYDPMPCCVELQAVPEDSNRMDAKRFYQNRFARIVPMYYLTQFMNIPLFFFGNGWVEPKGWLIIYMFVLDTFAAQAWFGMPLSLSGPGWTVSTLTFFYWIFPSLLPTYQAFDHATMRRRMCYNYWLNVFVAFLIFGVGTFVLKQGGFAFWIATAWPPSRLPIFLMGVLAGLCTRRGQSPYDETDPDSDVWARRADIHSAIYWCLIIACSAVSVATNGKIDLGMGFWGQVLLVWSQCVIIVAICKDEGKSWSSKIFRNSFLQGIGTMSMTLYLLHENIIYHCHWIFRNDTVWRDDPKMPVYCIPIVICVALPVAWFLTRFVETPLRNMLRAPKVNKE